MQSANRDARFFAFSRAILLASALATVAASAQAQAHHRPPPSNAGAGPFAAAAFGAFRDIVQRGDHAAKVRLADVVAAGATEAVGALSGLRGEISIVGGRLVVTCGSQAECAPAPQESAALLATAMAPRWADPIAIAHDMSQSALEQFIERSARNAGLPLDAAFPVRIRGGLRDAKMHVVSSPNPRFAGHGSGHSLAVQDEERAPELPGGEVVGMYAPPAWRGITTHPGEAFHFHWVDASRSRTAHLDGFAVKAGASLLLPRR